MDEKLVEHILACPLGWLDKKLIWSRRSIEWDVIVWLATLREMVGLPSGDGQLPLPDNIMPPDSAEGKSE